MILKKLVIVVASVLSAVACQSTKSGEKSDQEPLPPPPKLTEKTPTADVIKAGIDYGGETLSDAKKLIKRRGEGELAAATAKKLLMSGVQSLDQHQLVNAGHLYASVPIPVDPLLVKTLITSDRPLAQQLGWQLAAVKPNAKVAAIIDGELSLAINDGEEDRVIIPQMANAVRANKLKSAYTLVRQGLLTKGQEEFALAMLTLSPVEASNDFLSYLILATPEELRQLTLSNVNLYTCVAILKHMQKFPPDISRVEVEHLFVYAVSRNTALQELAQGVLESYIPSRLDILAQALSRQPVWVQMAYLEGVRRRMNPKQGLFISELKKYTAEHDVVQEINELRF